MAESTKEQIEEFWGWCGFEEKADWKRKGFHYELTVKCPNWIPPNPNSEEEEYGEPCLPRIDLNNLFKHAVPKANSDGIMMDIHSGRNNLTDELVFWAEVWHTNLETIKRREKAGLPTRASYTLKDPAEALYRALDKVRRAECSND